MDISWREDVIHGGFSQVKVSGAHGHIIEWLDRNQSSLSAMRRAIVGAAAEIGKSMLQEQDNT
jgi:hypothetical protein